MLLFVILLSNKLLVLALWETCGQYLVLPLAARLYFLFWPCKLALFKFAFFFLCFLCFLLMQTLCIWCWKRQTFPSIFSIHKCDVIDMSVDINKWVVERKHFKKMKTETFIKLTELEKWIWSTFLQNAGGQFNWSGKSLGTLHYFFSFSDISHLSFPPLPF